MLHIPKETESLHNCVCVPRTQTHETVTDGSNFVASLCEHAVAQSAASHHGGSSPIPGQPVWYCRTGFSFFFYRSTSVFGHTVAQLIQALRYKSRVRFSMLSLEFFIDIFLPAALWP